MKQNSSIFDDINHEIINMVSLSRCEALEVMSLIFIFRSLLIFLKVNNQLTTS